MCSGGSCPENAKYSNIFQPASSNTRLRWVFRCAECFRFSVYRTPLCPPGQSSPAPSRPVGCIFHLGSLESAMKLHRASNCASESFASTTTNICRRGHPLPPLVAASILRYTFSPCAVIVPPLHGRRGLPFSCGKTCLLLCYGLREN